VRGFQAGEDQRVRVRAIVEGGAHTAPVASQRPTARGRGFGMGAGGLLPSRATPSWRKGL
jgi:hypothetical protein